MMGENLERDYSKLLLELETKELGRDKCDCVSEGNLRAVRSVAVAECFFISRSCLSMNKY